MEDQALHVIRAEGKQFTSADAPVIEGDSVRSPYPFSPSPDSSPLVTVTGGSLDLGITGAG